MATIKKELDIYQLSEKINEISKYTFKSMKIGHDIAEIAEDIDNKLYGQKNFKPILPISIEPGPFAQNYSPPIKYIIKKEDIISFTIGIKTKKRILKVAHTRYFSKNNELAKHIIEAISEACNAGMKACGVDVRLLEPKNEIMEVLHSYEVASIINLCGHCLNDMTKLVPNIDPMPTMYNFCRGKMKEDETYFIDVYGTNYMKDDIVIDNKFPSIYYIPKPKQGREQRILNDKINKLKLLTSKKIIKWAKQKYGYTPFSARSVFKKFPNFKSHSTQNLYKNKLLGVYHSKYINVPQKGNDKAINNGIVSHIGHSVLIGKNGVKFLC
jgi:methionine aminopeptidase